MADRYASLKQGLVGCWIPSISGSGLLLPDLSGRGNNGVLTNMDASDWVSGQYGRALDFDGEFSHVRFPTFINGPSMPVWSVSLWLFTRTQTFFDGIFTNSQGSPFIFMRFGGSGDIDCNFASGIGTISGVSNSTWHHLAFVGNTNQSTLWFNGRLNSSTSNSPVDGRRNWWIGMDFNASLPRGLDGQMNDIRIYDRALTEPEIRLLSSEPGIGFKPAKKLSRFSQRYTYKPPKAKVFEGVRVRDHDYASLREGLVGAWCPSLPNGGSGNTLPDQSGRGNHGTLTNMGPEDWVSSGDGRALDFDGSNDSVVISSSGTPNISLYSTAQSSISAWVYTSFTSGDDFIYNEGNSGSPFFLLRISSGQAQFGRFQSGWSFSTDSNSLTLNSWQHLCGVYDGIGTKLYVNGRQVASAASNAFITNRYAWVTIGSRDSNADVFNGLIDDVRAYNRALTESEIRLLASRPGIGLQPSPTRFIAREKKTGLRRKILTGQT